MLEAQISNFWLDYCGGYHVVPSEYASIYIILFYMTLVLLTAIMGKHIHYYQKATPQEEWVLRVIYNTIEPSRKPKKKVIVTGDAKNLTSFTRIHNNKTLLTLPHSRSNEPLSDVHLSCLVAVTSAITKNE